MTHPMLHTNDPITIIGHHIRTDGAGSATAIPALWAAVVADNLLADIPGPLCGDVYAVYTNLEDAGVSNAGHFSFVLGVPVAASTAVPDGLVLVSVPRSCRLVFPAPENDPSRILEAWGLAWAHDDATKTFLCEYELYSETGEVSVNLGVHDPRLG